MPSTETPMHLAVYAAASGRGRGAHALARGHRAVRGPRRAAGHPLRDHRPRRAGPGRALRAVRVGGSGGRGGHGAGRPQRRRSCATTARSSYGRDLAQAYDRALLLEWLARTYRLALSYGEPAILSAAELDEVTAESRRRRYGERRSGQAMNPAKPASGAAMSEPQWRGGPGGAGHRRPCSARTSWTCSAGRSRTIPPGQGSVRLKEIRATAAGTAAGTGVDLAKLGADVLRHRRARRRPARRHRDRRDGPARHRHRRAGPQERRPDLGHHPADPAERRAARACTCRARPRCFTRGDVDLAGHRATAGPC